MNHFIRISLRGYSEVNYYYNDELNKTGDFSNYYYCSNNWYKYRMYRGRYTYSKKAHHEKSSGRREWHYDGRWYYGYEEYMMAVMG